MTARRTQLQVPARLGADRELPPADPKLCPALEVARPGACHGLRVVDWPEPWSFRFGGREERWHPVSVRARGTSPDGREVIQVRWSIEGSTFHETYYADPAKMRGPVG